MGVFGRGSKLKMFRGGTKIKKAYLGKEKIYSSGNIVTYVVDSGVTYLEEVDEGANVLAPKSFVPKKSGWDFVGWRLDTAANGDVLNSKVMGDEPIKLYAVFKQTVTLTYYNNSTSKLTSNGTKYYNNGNMRNPTFTLSQASKSGWTARGWATSTAGNASVAYSSISDTAFSTNTTLYGLYYKVCTLTAKSYNSTQTAQGTAYYNSAGNTTNATCTVPTGATYSGWSWRGWSAASTTGASASVSYGNGATYTLGTSDATIYGLYYQTIYLYYNGNGSTSGSVNTQSGTRYYNAYGNTSNPSFTLASNGYSRNDYTFTGWNLGAVGATVTLASNTTAYAQWVQTVINYVYTGSVQTFIAPLAGTYQLEVWGAQGAGNQSNHGAGGYAKGNVFLTVGQTIYVCVGAQSGYNGGGGAYNSAGNGGGATHIAKNTNRGLLSAYASYTSEVLIAAGGGGGGATYGSSYSAGGYGGGASGTVSEYYVNGRAGWAGQPGTQTSAGGNLDLEWYCDDDDHSIHRYIAYVGGSFGQGGTGTSVDECDGGYSGGAGGGGGGWYGGAGSAAENGGRMGGAGGSGYIGGVSGGSMSNGVQSGNGKAVITLLSVA